MRSTSGRADGQIVPQRIGDRSPMADRLLGKLDTSAFRTPEPDISAKPGSAGEGRCRRPLGYCGQARPRRGLAQVTPAYWWSADGKCGIW